MFTLHVEARTAEEFNDSIRGVRPLAADEEQLAGLPSETLLAELRQRLAPDGLVVKVVPFEGETKGAPGKRKAKRR